MVSIQDAISQAIAGLLFKYGEGKVILKQVSYQEEVSNLLDSKEKPAIIKKMIITYEEKESK